MKNISGEYIINHLPYYYIYNKIDQYGANKYAQIEIGN